MKPASVLAYVCRSSTPMAWINLNVSRLSTELPVVKISKGIKEVEVGIKGSSYDFNHDKIREVAYRQMSGARRQQVYRRVGEALETEYRLRLDEVVSRLAHAAHICENYQDFDGIKIPTKRRVLPLPFGHKPLSGPVIVAIDIHEFSALSSAAT